MCGSLGSVVCGWTFVISLLRGVSFLGFLLFHRPIKISVSAEMAFLFGFMDNTLLILSFNVNGLSHKDKQLRLKEFVKIHKPDIMCVQDTRLRNVRFLSTVLGAHSFFAAPSVARSGGIGVFVFSPRLQAQGLLSSPCGNILKLEVSCLEFSFFLISVYAPSAVADRTVFFRHILSPVLSSLSRLDKIVLCGDFNFVEDLGMDRRSLSLRHVSRADYYAFLESSSHLGLSDVFRSLFPSHCEFTFSSDAHGSSSRLDRVYSSSSLLLTVRRFYHISLPDGISDHSCGSALSIGYVSLLSGRNQLWRLNTRNLGKPGLSAAIDALSKRYLLDPFPSVSWWDDFKNDLRSVCRLHSLSEASRRRTHMAVVSRSVERLYQQSLASPEDMLLQGEYLAQKHHLDSYLSDRVNFLKFAARSRVLPNNSDVLRILSGMVTERKSATLISSLSDGSSVFSSSSDILTHASAFYEDLYSHVSSGLPSHPVWHSPTSHLTLDEHALLSRPITSKLLLRALLSLPNNKTPGMDGLPKEFYVRYWSFISPLFLRMVLQFLGGRVPSSLLQAATVLIFKKGDRTNVENYRPISLLGTDYKVIAKVLSMRLSPLLSSFIHSDQTGFVKGRCIHDSVSSIFDLTYFCQTYHRPGYLFLLDLRKAYDTLDRAFLFRALHHLGLPSHFLTLIHSLHVNSSMHLYVNGVVGRSIPVLSGVRQGCPLAPQLFICAIELFHRFSTSVLPAFRINSRASRLMTCYADDVTIFLEDPSILENVLPLLNEFASVSNERPNLNKCAVIPIGSAPRPLSSHFHDIPYIRQDAAERILGVFLSPSGSTFFTWNGLLTKLESRVKKWVNIFPVLLTRAVIVNQFLVPIFLYQARFHPPPATIWRHITCLLENFVSANKAVKTHAVQRLWSRDLIYASVKDGGLGVVNPMVRLQVLSLQRIAHLFRFKNDAASFSISTLHLPFHTRTFTSHLDILKHDFPLSFRWRSDLSAFFSSPTVISEPPLHPECILSEKLAFNRFILRT